MLKWLLERLLERADEVVLEGVVDEIFGSLVNFWLVLLLEKMLDGCDGCLFEGLVEVW